MSNRKWILTLIMVLAAGPAMCQLNNKVEVAIARAQAHRILASESELDPQLLIQAEERLQQDRNAHSGNARHNLSYYYDQVSEKSSASSVREEDPTILTRAEELLQKDRNAHSGNPVHTLEYYYQQVEKEMQQVTKPATPKYYVPLIQLKEEAEAPGADGAEAGLFWVEIGGGYTADGYEPEFFYLHSSKTMPEETNDGPMGPRYAVIVPSIFNEAYKRFASNPRSAKATISQTKEMLVEYYHQVEAEKKAKTQE